MTKTDNGHYMGFEKEPPTAHGPKETGKSLVHSHSKRPKRKITVGKRHGRKSS
jgi:hypothetical protein